MEDIANYNVGDEIKVDTFEIGDKSRRIRSF